MVNISRENSGEGSSSAHYSVEDFRKLEELNPITAFRSKLATSLVPVDKYSLLWGLELFRQVIIWLKWFLSCVYRHLYKNMCVCMFFVYCMLSIFIAKYDPLGPCYSLSLNDSQPLLTDFLFTYNLYVFFLFIYLLWKCQVGWFKTKYIWE